MTNEWNPLDTTRPVPEDIQLLPTVLDSVTPPVWPDGDIPDPDNKRTGEALNPEALRALEDVDYVPPSDKSNAVLVALGLRPAAWLGVVPEAATDTHGQSGNVPTRAEAYAQILRSLGVHVEMGPYDETTTESGTFRYQHIYIGHTREACEKLIAATPAPSDDPPVLDDDALGHALGFPESSVRAYVNHAVLSNQEMGLLDPIALAFGNFGVSKEHVHEDLATARHWAASVKAASPKIYSQVVENVRRRLPSAHNDPRLDPEYQEPPLPVELDPTVVQAIEQMPASISNRIDYLLIALGLKSATTGHLQGESVPDDGRTPPPVSEAALAANRTAFEQAGLSWIETPDDPMQQLGNKQTSVYRFFVARTPEEAAALQHGGAGAGWLLRGFPKTAIEAYKAPLERNIIDQEIAPAVKAFVQFPLSANHYREELEIPARWAAAVARVSPKLFLEYMRFNDVLPVPASRPGR